MATSQNKYAVLTSNRTTGSLPRLRHWTIPGTGRQVYLRDGSAGFLLAHVAHWFNENIEKIGTGTYDDWGWAVRPVRGQTSGYSNHASGTAIDLNATQHPRGRSASATFSKAEIAKIHKQLEAYEGVIRWGGDYRGTPDGMHFELNKPLYEAERVARKLWQSKHGKPVIDANPGAADVIWDGKVPGEKPPPDPPKPTKERLAADWSYARLNPQAVKAAGIRGVVRYLSGNPDKDITRDEADAILAAGMWLLLVFELRAKRAGEGRTAGIADAIAANAQADKVGYPRDACIMYAVDYDANAADVKPYFDGIHSVAGTRPAGAYGGVRIIDAGLADHGWQATAWSGGKVSKKAKLFQRTTHSVSIKGAKASDWDENKIIPGAIIPVWNPGEPAYKPPPPPPPPTPTGDTFVNAQFNSQHTDKANRQIRDVLIASDLVGLNEVESLWQRLILKTSPKFGVYPTRGTGGYVPVCWRKSVFEKVSAETYPVHKGEKGVTPARNVVKVVLRHKATKKIVVRLNGQSVAHVEVSGRERVYKGGEVKKYAGQLGRAKLFFAMMRARIVTSAVEGAVVAGGDFNVAYDSEKQLPEAKRVPYFPYSQLTPIAKPVMPKGGSHGSRRIDWVLIKGNIRNVRGWLGKQGASDHKPVFNELEPL